MGHPRSRGTIVAREYESRERGILLLLLLLRFLLGGLLRAIEERGGFFGIGGGFGELFVAFFVECRADADVNGEALAGETFIYAADGRNVTVVAAIGKANVTKADRIAEGGIEGEPSIFCGEDFGPGVGGMASDDFFLLRC